MSLAAPWLAGMDWAMHLALSPGKRLALAQLAFQQGEQFARYATECLMAGPGRAPVHRAAGARPAFCRSRMAALSLQPAAPGLLLNQQWWQQATHEVWGVEQHHADLVGFGTGSGWTCSRPATCR
jgi:polyhydroxyalkanoate synthase